MSQPFTPCLDEDLQWLTNLTTPLDQALVNSQQLVAVPMKAPENEVSLLFRLRRVCFLEDDRSVNVIYDDAQRLADMFATVVVRKSKRRRLYELLQRLKRNEQTLKSEEFMYGTPGPCCNATVVSLHPSLLSGTAAPARLRCFLMRRTA
jgi:hypothetical protein